MKVAVTGGTGFIGRYVIAELLQEPVDIIATYHKTPPTLLRGLSAEQIIPLDIQAASTKNYTMLGNPDILIHLAWGGLPNYKSLHHFETELPAQYHFLSSLIQAGLKKLFVAGTCFEYGLQSGALGEQFEAKPSTPYGFAKNSLRCQLEYLKMEHEFSLTWGRVFYIYGSGQSKNALFSQLQQAIKEKQRLFNMSGGEQLRDYLPVQTLARYIVKLALQKEDIGVVNICSGQPISIRKLVETWLKQNQWHIQLNLGYFPYPDYEPMAFWGDNTKLQNLLGE